MKNLLVLLAFGLLSTTVVSAQNTKKVTGKVTDENGKVLSGVTVSVGAVKTTSDDNGNYSLQVPAGSSSVKFSFVGYSETDIKIGNKTTIDARLNAETNQLAEVVVVGYGVQQKKAFTGSASKIDAKEFSQLVTPSVDRQLAGRAAGVQVVSGGGDVGAPARIRIRGVNSVSQNQSPLIVVDGVPFISGNIAAATNSNALGDINPNDIENIEVLKDGSATAIFGSRAANGVIMITTKKGSKGGAMKVNYDATFGFTSPFKTYDLLNNAQFVEIANEKRTNAGLTGWAAAGDGKTYDWQRLVMRDNTPTSQHNLSFSGGTNKSTYFFSLNYSDQKGILISNANKSYRIRFNFDNEINKYIKIGNNLTLSKQIDNDQNNGSNALSGGIASALRMLPNVNPFDPNQASGYNIRFPQLNQVGLGPNTNPVDDNYTNPLFTLTQNRYESDKLRVNNNLYVEISPMKGLKIRSAFNYDFLNDYSTVSLSPVHGDGFSSLGNIQNIGQQVQRMVWQNYMNYNTTLFDNHNVYLTAGHEVQEDMSKFVSGSLQQLSDPFFQQKNVISGSGALQFASGGYGMSGFHSLFGRLNYDFKNKYFVQGSVRRDGQSSLSPTNRFGVFPGASVGYRISEEGFWKNNQFLAKTFSDVKLKGSYAIVGNQLGGFPYLSTFGSAAYGNIPGLAPNLIGNAGLQWERSKKMDVGIELGLFNNRFNFVADWFLNDIDQLVFAVPTPNSAGIPGNSISQNVGTARNNGIELALSGDIIRAKNFTWGFNANFTTIENKITSLYSVGGVPVTTIPGAYNRIEVGQSLNYLWGWQYAGVNTQTGNPMYLKANGTLVQRNTTNGTYFTAADKNDGTMTTSNPLTDADRVNLGNSLPTYFGAITNNFRYKNFSMEFMIRFQGGNMIMNQTRQEALLSQNFHNNGTEILNRWKAPGDVTDVPRLRYAQSATVNQTGAAISRFVEKGDFVRLQNVVFSYSFNNETLSKYTNGYIKNARVFAQGQNLFMLTNYSGLDPDNASQSGIDNAVSPTLRILSVGLNVGF
ncbi:MAG: SusC/RagA family TonB-linked outer membrane protein [Sediminibacterium sp.]|jgi:TonB-dependent starch-binding outer membrane protein SusC